MKKVIPIFAVIAFCITTMAAQNSLTQRERAIAEAANYVPKAVAPDPRLLTVFEPTHLTNMPPAMLERLNLMLDHAYQIETTSEKNMDDVPSIDIANLATFNIHQFMKERKLYMQRSATVFRINNTNKILVILSEDAFVKKYNELTGRKY